MNSFVKALRADNSYLSTLKVDDLKKICITGFAGMLILSFLGISMAKVLK